MIIKYDNSLIDYRISNKSSLEIQKLAPLHYWWLELNDKGLPVRELGFNDHNQVKYAAPMDNDRGLWCDSPVSFNINEWNEIATTQEFKDKWSEFLNKLSE
jgi:hypothetical protein